MVSNAWQFRSCGLDFVCESVGCSFDLLHAQDLAPAAMSKTVDLKLCLPGDLAGFKLPPGVQSRLDQLLDKQDLGQPLTTAERREAEGLVDLAEMLSLLKLRATRVAALA